MPPADPQKAVEHGTELPPVLGRSFWKNGGGLQGHDAVDDDIISADPVNRIWQRAAPMEDTSAKEKNTRHNRHTSAM